MISHNISEGSITTINMTNVSLYTNLTGRFVINVSTVNILGEDPVKTITDIMQLLLSKVTTIYLTSFCWLY